MSRYVLDINSGIAQNVIVFGMLGEKCISTAFKIDELEELNNDYIDKHYDFLQDEAYQRGLNDAWEAARKIACDDGIDTNTLCTIFKRGCGDSIIRDYSAAEAIEKLKAYKEKQKNNNEIKVGDEVESLYDDRTIVENTIPWIVTKIREGYKGKKSYYGIDAEGTLRNNDFVRKTGRHFDIDKILKQMKVEEDFSDF